MEDLEVQLIRPPARVRRGSSDRVSARSARERAFGVGQYVLLLLRGVSGPGCSGVLYIHVFVYLRLSQRIVTARLRRDF